MSYASYPQPHITQRFAIGSSGTRGGGGVAPAGAAVAPDAMLADVTYGTGQSRGILWRGMADTDVERDVDSGAPIFDPALITLTNALSAQLSADNWGFCVNDPTNAIFPVINFAPDLTLPGRWRVSTNALSTLPTVGQPVVFRGVPRAQVPWLTGKFLVRDNMSGPPQSFAIDLPAGVQPAYSGAVDVSRLTYQQFAPAVSKVTTLFPADWRTRKTGRPITLTRGRARGLRYRR